MDPYLSWIVQLIRVLACRVQVPIQDRIFLFQFYTSTAGGLFWKLPWRLKCFGLVKSVNSNRIWSSAVTLNQTGGCNFASLQSFQLHSLNKQYKVEYCNFQILSWKNNVSVLFVENEENYLFAILQRYPELLYQRRGWIGEQRANVFEPVNGHLAKYWFTISVSIKIKARA